MTRYNRFTALTNIREDFILESMPDHLGISSKRRKSNPIGRFLGSGWGAACICAVVALAVTIFVIRAGQEPWESPAGQVEETDEITQADTTAPEPKEYQGMTADIPYKLSYYSNGDGTCSVNGIITNILYKGEYTIEIPETSPDGDIVESVKFSSNYNIPTYVLAEDFEKIKAAMLDYYESEDNYYYKQFMSYFLLKGLEFIDDSPEGEEQKAELLKNYPLCQVTNIYVFDVTATSVECGWRSMDIKNAMPEYTAKHCYADLLEAKKLADKHGITDPNLENAMAQHSGSFENAVAVKLPKTLRYDGVWAALYPGDFTLAGIQNLTFDGTMEEYLKISDVYSTRVSAPLTVHCTDGDLNYPVEEQ